MLLSEQFETTTNTEITVVKTFCDFGHNIFEKQLIWPFFIRTLARSYEQIWQPWTLASNRVARWAVFQVGWPYDFQVGRLAFFGRFSKVVWSQIFSVGRF